MYDEGDPREWCDVLLGVRGGVAFTAKPADVGEMPEDGVNFGDALAGAYAAQKVSHSPLRK